MSDFIDNYEDALKIAGKKHDLVGIKLFDPREADLPPVGLMKLHDAESGIERWIDTSSRSVRDEFAAHWQRRRAQRKDIFVRSRVDAIPIRVDRPYIKPIVDFFRLRERRR